ncbi:efflux RND transporter periplasmic adaptor subunit [Chromatium okenii]|uniref:Efflux RND transporter periplasmic adaptor subunit n=1 Tax=Chromatium okenii TaxID=61644 RepID=A0A2S7XRT5_9GAMM|nr:efflux RND transporter periplasmic adaptor subunit [Chromatium okenii]PQJ96263.1 efflux RND transporter periplasmic adaptor subunit [Chromatium okenii]
MKCQITPQSSLIALMLFAPLPLALADPNAPPPWVLTVPLEIAIATDWHLIGSVCARHEIPLAFRINGEIRERRVDVGAAVTAGQVLFQLDPRDVIEQRIAAEATVASARAETENAQRERERLADMLRKKLVSQQDYDRAATAARAASGQLTAAQAVLQQARYAIEYATLTAPAAGVMVAVSGQQGQVIAAGQIVATVAEAGAREIEVAVPETRRTKVPLTALALVLGQAKPLPVTLREVAETADPVMRTWAARYQFDDPAAAPALGTTITLRFAAETTTQRLRVPLGAVLEQAEGAMVWRVVDGRVQPESVTVLAVDDEFAEIQTTLPLGTPVVALGVNRLQPGQAVRMR